jgi:hypothetical protein
MPEPGRAVDLDAIRERLTHKLAFGHGEAAAMADIAALLAEYEKLLGFARKILNGYYDCAPGDLDGGDVQDWAVEAGLLVPTEMTKACGENCVCAEMDDFPQTCYRLSAALAPEATEETRHE